jgi:hypothetical protein
MRSETREFNIEALNKPIRTFIYCFVVGAIIYIEPSRTPGGAKLKRNFLKMKRRKTLAITQKEKKNTRGRTYFFFYSLGRCSLVNTGQLLSFDGPTRHNNSCRQSALAKGKAEPAARTYACSGTQEIGLRPLGEGQVTSHRR